MPSTDSLVTWVKSAVRPSGAQGAAIDSESLGDVLKWASGGFVLLTGLLTFFGIKEGALDRLVRASAVETMAIFLFIGLGVLLALVAPALDPERKAPVALVILAVGALVLVSGVVVGQDLADERLSGPLAVAFWVTAVVGVAAVLFVAHRGYVVRWNVAFAVLALTSVACGLYNAAKLSVLDKLDVVGAAITANLSDKDGQRALALKVTGKDVATPVRIEVEGLGPGTHPVLSEHVLTPDRTDSLDADITVPVSGTTWTELRVVACQDESRPPTGAATACAPNDVYAKFPIVRDDPSVGASLALNSKDSTVAYTVDAVSLPSTAYLDVVVKQGRTTVATARRAPEADGTVSWAGTSSVKPKQEWTITVTRCDVSAEPACAAAEVLAKLVVG